MRLVPLYAMAVAILLALLVPNTARAIDRNFAGSGQIDYMWVPTAKDADANLNNGQTFDGFTMELAMKVAVDISDHVSANVKVCYGCHGFEVDMAHVDYRVADELNFRMGRFSPSFGAFNLRHDPANHRLSDKPLPYDMGRMLRLRDWNLGVLPSPFPDNGVEINGTHWFGDKVQLDYAAYAVAGFKSNTNNPNDLDFTISHGWTSYYIDNNARPTGGARVALTARLTDQSDLTFGASGMMGTYDINNDYYYLIAGGDVTLRLKRTVIRAEYLMRQQQFATPQSDATTWKRETTQTSETFGKHGAYIEVEQPITKDLDLMLRFDGLYRAGNVLKTSILSEHSAVGRVTFGGSYALERDLRLKASAEFWDFSDLDTNGHSRELSLHLGAVGTF